VAGVAVGAGVVEELLDGQGGSVGDGDPDGHLVLVRPVQDLDIQVDPAASGHPGQETGLASIWSPLSAAELHRQSREILQGARSWIRFFAFLFVFDVLVLALGLGVVVEGDPAAGAIFVALGVAGLALCVPLVQQERTSKRIALALSAAAREQDDPSIPIEPPDLRTN
jgi:hypothetical protein